MVVVVVVVNVAVAVVAVVVDVVDVVVVVVVVVAVVGQVTLFCPETFSYLLTHSYDLSPREMGVSVRPCSSTRSKVFS